jgi:hypothetical protein
VSIVGLRFETRKPAFLASPESVPKLSLFEIAEVLIVLLTREVVKMTLHLWKTHKATFFAAVLIGNALPTVARAQSVILKINDAVVAEHIGTGSQFALYNTKDPSHCIGIYDPAAINLGKDALTPAGLSNAAELQAINDAAPLVNGKHFVQMGLYSGPAVHLGECNVGQASANYAAAAQQTAAPAQSGQDVVAAQMAALSNSVKLEFKILKADAKQALIQITDSNHQQQHMMKIEADAGGVTAFRDSFKTSAATNSSDGNFKSWGGHSIRLAIDNGNARYYNPDGTPQVAKENKFSGESTSRIMQLWDKSTFADMADKIKAQLGSDPPYSTVLYAIAGKPAGTATEPQPH